MRVPDGQRLDDPDADRYGDCVPDVVAVNAWTAQAAAEASGLPLGTACRYPDTVVAGDTAVIDCNVVNADGSEGSWSFVIGADSSLRSAAAYTETKPAPTTTQPPTTPPPVQPVQPMLSTTDPRFDTCKEAKKHGYGPYRQGEPEYGWYRDADSDGIVCE